MTRTFFRLAVCAGSASCLLLLFAMRLTGLFGTTLGELRRLL